MSAMLRKASEISPTAFAQARCRACARGQLQRRRVAFSEFLTIARFDQLTDGQHTNIAKDHIEVLLVTTALASGEDHIHVVVG